MNGKNSKGPLIGTIIVVIILIIGGIYLWQGRQKTPVESTSDKVEDIEIDLNQTGLDDLGTELDDINRELELEIKE